jgi:hypothetical protein
VGEVYAVSHRQVREVPPQLIVDQAVQRGTKQRPAKLVTRKNDEAYVLDLTQDVLDTVRWHVGQGYAGEGFLFSKTGECCQISRKSHEFAHRLSPHRRSATPLSRAEAPAQNRRVCLLPPAHLLRGSVEPIASHQRSAGRDAALP